MSKSPLFFDYLKSKSSEYCEIDINRFPKCWSETKEHFKEIKAIQIIGTNGKGSTGRFLAWFLKDLGLKVGHYSSPHIKDFEERIWIDGALISKDRLEEVHASLEFIREKYENLSYFEYSTLVAYKAFESLDIAILEAGLGGEFDATSSFRRDLVLITPIHKDHERFLGNEIESIIATKLRCIKSVGIFFEQPNMDTFKEIAQTLENQNSIEILDARTILANEEISLIKRYQKELNLPSFQVQNIALALSGAKYLGFKSSLESIKKFDLYSRSQKIRENIKIDVGHNILAATEAVKNIESKETILVFGVMEDKNYYEVLKIFKQRVEKIFIVDISSVSRACKSATIEAVAKDLGYSIVEKIDIEDDILYVFGSFFTVEKFLKKYLWSGFEK